jgi:hypothetical protein
MAEEQELGEEKVLEEQDELVIEEEEAFALMMLQET